MQLPRRPSAFASRVTASAAPSGHPGIPASYERFARAAPFACLALHRISTGMHKIPRAVAPSWRSCSSCFSSSRRSPRTPTPSSRMSRSSISPGNPTSSRLLRRRYPDITPEQIKEAHAYAYGGAIIQDIGYYPFGNKLLLRHAALRPLRRLRRQPHPRGPESRRVRLRSRRARPLHLRLLWPPRHQSRHRHRISPPSPPLRPGRPL